MNRSKKFAILLVILVVCCAAAVAALRIEARQEQIKTSGEVVLSIEPSSVQTLSWSYEDETYSFHWDTDVWLYDEDEAFPVDGDKITALLEQFQQFSAAFTIEEVEDYAQYGLDDPLCTIDVTTEDASWQILLGDYSTMDSQRYVSIGDDKVYLAVSDPLDVFDVELSDLIENDTVPSFDQVTEITFSGTENYTVSYEEDSTATYCADDVYFTQLNSAALALDTSLVNAYVRVLRNLDLTDYISYNATEEELASSGLDDPELTVTVRYTYEDEDGETVEDTFVLSVSRDPEQRDSADDSEEEDDEEILAYVRVGDSPILYQISADEYTDLMAASRNDLRHQEIFSGDFGDVTQLDISLDGEDYTITSEETDGARVYFYQEEELDISALQDALEDLEAEEFTEESPTLSAELSLTLHLDNEFFPEVQITLYRCDGTLCLAVVDGEPVAYVLRSQMVELAEAIRAIVLN